jgi:hypothetical protein
MRECVRGTLSPTGRAHAAEHGQDGDVISRYILAMLQVGTLESSIMRSRRTDGCERRI